MFETDLILWLQSAASPAMSALMMAITETGSMEFVVLASIVVAFAIDLRIGALLFVMLFWTDVLTDVLKGWFALPRPVHVDVAVQSIGAESLETPFSAAGGDGFFDLPRADAIEYYRTRGGISFGLPSGHVGMVTALWVGIALLLRSRPMGIVAAGMVAAMMISRMYLGKHFLADVIGGLVLALGIVAVGQMFVSSGTSRESFASLRRSAAPWSVPLIAGALLVLPIVVLAADWTTRFDKAGRVTGATVAFLLLAHLGFSAGRTLFEHRITGVLVASFLFGATHLAARAMLEADPATRALPEQFLFGFLPPLVGLLGTVGLGSLLQFYCPRDPTRRPPEALGRS
jgi:membrane-associated phospholipid phosphatase